MNLDATVQINTLSALINSHLALSFFSEVSRLTIVYQSKHFTEYVRIAADKILYLVVNGKFQTKATFIHKPFLLSTRIQTQSYPIAEKMADGRAWCKKNSTTQLWKIIILRCRCAQPAAHGVLKTPAYF